MYSRPLITSFDLGSMPILDASADEQRNRQTINLLSVIFRRAMLSDVHNKRDPPKDILRIAPQPPISLLFELDVLPALPDRCSLSCTKATFHLHRAQFASQRYRFLESYSYCAVWNITCHSKRKKRRNPAHTTVPAFEAIRGHKSA